ncbi:MAG: polynucleotide adenylyltransferase, partial [Lachnospiraceae bacterium]|nr:polynucleotide adenylyltransferase [Lachnospiraceae bacterium]
MQIRLAEPVKKIIAVLEAHGHEAYAVGGCVRDAILGRTPNDWDVTTSALPQEVKKLFRKTVDTGIQHGTVTVIMQGIGYEVTTYRIDGLYKDSRHPDSVTFTDRLSEDLLRRDFTINAMAYNDARGLQDCFGGQDDLKNRIIRAVGIPKERFTEDALRILRCVRFAAQLDFAIDDETYRAAKALSGNLKEISKERIREEFLKTLTSLHPE